MLLALQLSGLSQNADRFEKLAEAEQFMFQVSNTLSKLNDTDFLKYKCQSLFGSNSILSDILIH